MMPIYSDDPIFKNLKEKENEKNLAYESIHHQTLKQAYISSKIKESNDLGRILKQSFLESEMRTKS